MNAAEIKVYNARRARLSRLIGAHGVAVVSAAPTATYAQDVEYPYRQDNNFHYLTNFPEPNACAIVTGEGDYILFCQERDTLSSLWTGERIGCRRAVSRYGVRVAYPIEQFDKRIDELLRAFDTVYCDMDSELPGQLLDRLRAGRGRGAGVPGFADIAPLLSRLRWKKSADELCLMRKAAEISIDAHQHAWRICKPGMYEYEVAAKMEYTFARAGARTAYPSIVASGKNACVLHYMQNTARLKKGELLLIDAGSEYQHYASDITRTFPVSGRFTTAQRELYEVVLEAQLAAIKKATTAHTLATVDKTAIRSLTGGLVRLGLLKGRVATLIKSGAYRRFYMHRTGHWLGLGVHDCPRLPAAMAKGRLQAGVVLTVEPGLYIPNARDIPKHWRGTGIRIEDDVLVTARGNAVLTQGLAKEPDAIEDFMNASGSRQ